MQDFESILLSQLRDIHGIHEVSAWPLAAGWWLVMFLFFTFIFILVKKIIHVRQYKASWKYEIEKELEEIAANADLSKAKANISRINDILKRLSIRFYGRQEPAALAEKKWLVWLTNRDPSNFNWIKKGEILVEFPYMQEDKIKAEHEQIAALAKAVKPWLKL